LAVGRLRLASMPEVGIFWWIDNKVADSIPWRQADAHGGFYCGKNDHAVFWRTLQQLRPQWQGKEYTDFPRGRVLFDSMEAVFLVYSSRGIVNSSDLKKMILTEFKLASFKSEISFQMNFAFQWSTRRRWFSSILEASIKILVEHWKYYVFIVIVRDEFRSRQWRRVATSKTKTSADQTVATRLTGRPATPAEISDLEERMGQKASPN
jgi:hypothetical protein